MMVVLSRSPVQFLPPAGPFHLPPFFLQQFDHQFPMIALDLDPAFLDRTPGRRTVFSIPRPEVLF